MSKQRRPPPSRGGSGKYSEFDLETTPKFPGPDPSTYPSLTVGMTVAMMLGVTALLIGLGLGGFVGYFYDRENTRYGDLKDALDDLQAQLNNRTAVTTFPDDLFAIFHGADPSRRFCFDALQIETGMKRTLTVQDKNGTLAYLADIPVGGAPDDATYLTLSTDIGLTNERVLVMDADNFDTSDFGPNAAFVVDLSDTGVVAATYTRATIEVDSKGRILSASSNSATNSSAATFLDDSFMVLNAVINNKVVMLDVGSVSTFTTRIMTIPNLDGTLALTSGIQTFSDKTLTSPIINGGTIDGVTVTTSILIGSTNTIDASAVQTTGSAVDFASAAPPAIGQVPVFDGISAINWQNMTGGGGGGCATCIATAGVGVTVDASAQPGAAGYVLTTTTNLIAAWVSTPAVSSGTYSPAVLSSSGVATPPNACCGVGKWMRIGNMVHANFVIAFGQAAGGNPVVSVTVTVPFIGSFPNFGAAQGQMGVCATDGFFTPVGFCDGPFRAAGAAGTNGVVGGVSLAALRVGWDFTWTGNVVYAV